jgi:hypothetical protein
MRGAKTNALFLKRANRNPVCPCVALVISRWGKILMMIRATVSLVVLASLVALTENCCCEQKGVVDDEKAWTDLVEVFIANESKSMTGTQVSNHLAAIKAVSLGTHFHHELAPKLIEIFVS